LGERARIENEEKENRFAEILRLQQLPLRMTEWDGGGATREKVFSLHLKVETKSLSALTALSR
jgi:hypothetical protein